MIECWQKKYTFLALVVTYINLGVIEWDMSTEETDNLQDVLLTAVERKSEKSEMSLFSS